MKRGAPDGADGSDAKKARGGSAEADVHVYQPCVVLPNLKEKMNSLVEVLLPAKYLTGDYKPVKLGHVLGSDVYTDDSDLVAVLAIISPKTRRFDNSVHFALLEWKQAVAWLCWWFDGRTVGCQL